MNQNQLLREAFERTMRADPHYWVNRDFDRDAIDPDKYDSRATQAAWHAWQAAIAQPADGGEVACECHRCIKENDLRSGGLPRNMTKMILCPTCGNKRCPHASDHRLECTGSNESDQPGSVYTAQPASQEQAQQPQAQAQELPEPELGYVKTDKSNQPAFSARQMRAAMTIFLTPGR